MILKGTGWNSGSEEQRLNNGAMEVHDKNARDADSIAYMLRVAGGLQRASRDLAASDEHADFHPHIPPHSNPVTRNFDHGDPATNAIPHTRLRPGDPERDADPRC